MNIYQWKAPHKQAKTHHAYHRYNDDGTKQPDKEKRITKRY